MSLLRQRHPRTIRDAEEIASERLLSLAGLFQISSIPRLGRLSLFAGMASWVVLIGSVVHAQDKAPEARTNQPDEQTVVDDNLDGLDDLEDIDLLELELPIVVTASRFEQRFTTVPYAMSVITAADIRRSGARSVPDALRLVPGIDVADLSFGNAAVSPRGLHGFLGRQVLVLVDGRQIFDAVFGGTLWGNWPFQLEDIARIEVIRGPGGVAWGANAVNGVINIITKDPADQLGLRLITSGGSHGTFKQYVSYGEQRGNMRFRISGEYAASDGYRKGGSVLGRLDDELKAGRLSLRAIYDLAPDEQLVVSAGHALIDGLYPPSPLGRIGAKRNSGSQASFIMGTWTKTYELNNDLKLTGYINDVQVSPGQHAIDYRYQQISFQLSHSLVPHYDHRVTWGFDTRIDLLDASNSDPPLLEKDFVHTFVTGLYVQDRWHFAPTWVLDTGVRLDYESYGGFEPSARIALSHELNEHTMIYGSVSRAFQMPPAALRFMRLPLLSGISYVTARRSMDAQSLLAYELGFRGRFFDRLETSAAVYWHEFDNLTPLAPQLGPPGLIHFNLDNRAEASMYGVELDLKFAATRKLTLLANYTYQQLEWRSDIPFSLIDAMSPPKHKAMVGARYSPTDDIHLSGHLYYVDATEAPNPVNPFGPRRIDSYLRLDLLGEIEFWDDQASLSLGVRNLLDSNHREGGTLFLNDAEVPRMIYAEFRIQLR